MNKTIWLSGSRGFVGSYVAKYLYSAGYDTKCLSNSPTEDKKVIYADFSNKKHIRETIKLHGVPDTFIHLGWGNVYQPHNPEHLTTNLQNGINLIDEMFDRGVDRFIMIGSSSEYGDRVGALTEDLGPEGAVNNYVKAKIALAQYGLKAAERHKRKYIHVRLFYTYGAGQKHNSLINQLFQAYFDDMEMSLSPCEQYRDYIHVSEAAEGIIKITDVENSGIINLGSGTVIKLRDFVHLFWSELGANPQRLIFGAHDAPSSEQSQPRSFSDLNTLRNLTHWSPVLSIEEGIKKTIEVFGL